MKNRQADSEGGAVHRHGAEEEKINLGFNLEGMTTRVASTVTLPGILFINIRCQSRLEGNNR